MFLPVLLGRLWRAQYLTVGVAKETREGWPLLTVETEVKGDSKRTNDRVPSLVDSLDLSCRY
jgi:hypothetical protein